MLIGIACASTAETIQLGEHAQNAGATGVLVVNPYYAKLSDDARFTHYKRIAEALSIPVFLYNFPELTGQDIGLDVITRLAREVPNIVGIKDTIDNISHTGKLLIASTHSARSLLSLAVMTNICLIRYCWAVTVESLQHLTLPHTFQRHISGIYS